MVALRIAVGILAKNTLQSVKNFSGNMIWIVLNNAYQ